jgi:putative endonuclease
MNDQYYWVYILLCNNHSYYTGYTNDLIKRYQSHIDGSSRCKYTRSFKPIALAQSWFTTNKSAALKLECQIKTLSRQQKTEIILNPSQLIENNPVKPIDKMLLDIICMSLTSY